MKVPVSWLAEYVDLPSSIDELAARLTAAGLKVESVQRPGAEIDGVIVAEVLKIQPHPDADRLVLVDIRTDVGESHVVCGAKNFAVGDRVPFATPGSTLPGGKSIGASTIRGQKSEGMLCSGRELGVTDDHSGILILQSDTQLGSDIKKVLGLDEVVLELEITPSRPDAMSVLGVAREVSVLTGASLRPPPVEIPAGAMSNLNVAESISVEISDADRCPRYLARVVRGVKVAPSPERIQRRLRAAGVRPVNNVVDAANYVLLALGHPLHAFDLAKVEEGKIVVRLARAGEKVTTIDGAGRTLDPDDLVIADAANPVAIAGVMGGSESEVSVTTTDLLIESAYFDPRSIMRSGTRHNLRSEASIRFERGADPNGVEYAADLAVSLITSWAGGTIDEGVVDEYPKKVEPRVVTMRTARCRLLLGTDPGDDEMVDALSRLGLQPRLESGVITVTAPTYRPDIAIEEDLVEEVGRILGYDRIPSRLPSSRARAGALTTGQKLQRKLRQILAGAGLNEAQTSTMFGPNDVKRMQLPSDHLLGDPIWLANPLNTEESLLRTSMLPALLSSIERNIARRNHDIRLFEIGPVFLKSGEVLPHEPSKLSMVMAGGIQGEWHSDSRSIDFYDLKGAVEALVAGLRVKDVTYRRSSEGLLHPGRAADLLVGSTVAGSFGELAPHIAMGFELGGHRAYVAEFSLDAIFAGISDAKPSIESTRFPAVLIDVAMSFPESVPAQSVLDAVRQSAGPLLRDARVFDVYRGEQAGEDRKSLAISLSFRSDERTLTEAEVIEVRDKVCEHLAALFDGRVRGS
ncbi:MAG: phenylalanine--tRNA ligase subunit beta [Actinomycetota bacterium]